MSKHSNVLFGFIAVLVAVAMIGCTLITAGADSKSIPQEEITAIVDTVTDPTQITSPFIQVSNAVRNSVVGVNQYSTATYYSYGFGFGFGNQFPGETRESLSGTGSGVVISNYGHVLTNYHVVEGASRVTVTTGVDEEEHNAEIVGFDSDLDLAVLLVSGLNLPAVQLGDSDQLQVGEWAVVIGNPLGERFARSMTVGVVSGIDREVTDTTTDRYGRRTNITNSMIQVDAAVNSGNSGGGMFNVLGQLQGIPARYMSGNANSIFSTSSVDVDNIGMCIPINVAKPLIREVLAAYDGPKAAPAAEKEQSADSSNPLHGKPRLGVTISTVSSSAAGTLPLGALVRSVEPGSPADEGGILPGDIIVEVGEEIITSSTALTTKLADYQEGDQIAVKVYRDEGLAAQMEEESVDLTKVGEGEYKDLTVTLRVIDQLSM